MLYKLTDNEIRNLCREKLESLEYWLRRLIDETLSDKYGDYFLHTDGAGDRLISSKIVKSLEGRLLDEPSRYRRKIDAVLLEDAVAIVCKPQLYTYFKPAFKQAFPDGANQVRTFLTRLLDPRNKLAHANPISLRQAEQVLCYSNDVIDSFKSYYAELGLHQEYNVPLILKVTDSFGNTYYRSQTRNSDIKFKVYLDKDERFFLRPGDILVLEVEIDPAFDPSEYKVHWWTRGRAIQPNPESSARAVISLLPQDVGVFVPIYCTVRTNKEWHRLQDQGDDVLSISYKVLPPPAS